MADNAKIQVVGVYSKNTDYSDPSAKFRGSAYTAAPDEYMHVEIQADTSPVTLTTSHLASATGLIIKNNDPTNYVIAKWRSAEYDGSAVKDNQLRVAAGGFVVTTDFTTANGLVLTANTAACECEVLIFGT